MNTPATELDYYAGMLSKIRNKKYEFFVISRIVHLLNDRELEITTQQLVRTKDGRFLFDLYFPQLKLAIEVDEPHHKSQITQDKMREMAVVDAAEVSFLRIEIKGKTIDEVNSNIDAIVKGISRRKEELSSNDEFVPYAYGTKYSIDYWLSKRCLRISDDARFRTHVDVARLFGRNYKGHQQANIRLGGGYSVWFPKLYKNGDWDNRLSPDGKTIAMEKVPGGKFDAILDKDKQEFSYVFAHYRDEFGNIYYSFKGLFKRDVVGSINSMTFSRIADAIQYDGKRQVEPLLSM